MPENAVQFDSGKSVAVAEGWSAGIFAAAGTRVPEACLHRCLNGNGNLTPTHGCAMIKALARRARMRCHATPSADLGDTPVACGQGFGVSLHLDAGEGGPDVLILHPPLAQAPSPAFSARAVVEQAAKVLRETLVENWRLNRENDALADEVLHGYEQINFIFDVSSEVSPLHDGRQIQQTLLGRLRDMFNADAVFLISHGSHRVLKGNVDGQFSYGSVPGAVGMRHLRTPLPDPSTVDDILVDWPGNYEVAAERLCGSSSVFVTSPQPDRGDGRGTTLWGVLKDGGRELLIVAVIRKQFPFASVDMLLLDSALTFCGHILSNLRLVERLKQTSIETVRALVNAIDAKDQYTCGHSERVGFLARVTGEQMGLPAEQIQQLEWAGLLHDIGKIGIPEAVLNKPGSLTAEEYQIIKGHPAQGYNVLRPVESLEPVLAGVLYHHENPDGSGYPRGLTGEEIPLIARIVHVVDVFDALTSTRSYRSAFDSERAIGILRKDAGTKLDADCVASFLETWEQLPISHPAEFQNWFGGDAGGVA